MLPAEDLSHLRSNPESEEKAAKMKRRKTFVLGTLATFFLVTILVIIGLVHFTLNVPPPSISDDQLIADLSQSDIVLQGIMSSEYVDHASYEVTDANVISISYEPGKAYGWDGDAALVKYDSCMKNANFESSFSGTAYYRKKDQNLIFSHADYDSSSTIPLKGVDKCGEPYSVLPEGSSGSFESDLSDADGCYLSTACQTIVFDTWFAKISITAEQSFEFDAQKGWLPLGDASQTGKIFESKLPGKTFSGQKALNQGDGYADYSLTFESVSENNEVTAWYSVDYHPNKNEVMSASGPVVGTIEYGGIDNTFSIVGLADFGTTFTCSGVDFEGTATNEILIDLRRSEWSPWPPLNDLNGTFTLTEKVPT